MLASQATRHNAALAPVQGFIGTKIFVAHLLGWSKFLESLAFTVTLAIISAGIVYALYRKAK